MNTVFSYSRNSKVRLTHTKINLTYCLITILTCAFCLTVANGCSNDLRENSEDKITAKAEPVNFEDIKEQINKSLKFRREGLAKFDEESKESNREFLRDRAKQEQLAMHLWSSIEKVREHIEFVKTGKKIRDRFEILSSDERLEVAKLAETVLANSDESAIKEASTSAYEKQKKD